jgi:hypothetical protein
MMLRLLFNVTANRVALGGAYGKRAVTFLDQYPARMLVE